jgi:hypothetical protein
MNNDHGLRDDGRSAFNDGVRPNKKPAGERYGPPDETLDAALSGSPVDLPHGRHRRRQGTRSSRRHDRRGPVSSARGRPDGRWHPPDAERGGQLVTVTLWNWPRAGPSLLWADNVVAPAGKAGLAAAGRRGETADPRSRRTPGTYYHRDEHGHAAADGASARDVRHAEQPADNTTWTAYNDNVPVQPGICLISGWTTASPVP